MILLKNITLRNFLSVGQVTQAVNFDRQDLTLILGENLDLGGDGARNGTGKTSLIQGLSYVLFGSPINSIRKDNLVNRTNGKNMLVTLEFSVDGIEYKVERGRKPNILRFYVNNNLQKVLDDSQGDSRETQQAIEKVINMSADMFKHIVALNTYSEPFLAMKTNDQRNIIEQLLGITILSEKAENIKTLIKDSKDGIQAEEFRVKAVEEANKRVIEQIDSLKRRQKLWITKHAEDLAKYTADYTELAKIDIAKELQAHKALVIYNDNKKINDTYDSLIARQIAWAAKRDKEVVELQKLYNKLNSIDIAVELDKHIQVTAYNQRVKDKADYDLLITRLKSDISRDDKTVIKLEKELISLREHTCYACGQEFHDEKHTQVLTDKEQLLIETYISANTNKQELQNKLANPIVLGKMPSTHYKTEAEAIKHSGELESLLQKVNDKIAESDPYNEQVDEIRDNVITLGRPPVTIYDTEAEAVTHSSSVANLLKQIENKNNEIDPYGEQITDMENKAIQEANFDVINKLTRTMEHQKFLLDLLVSKDSFVRKKIIDQNLSYLNARLTHYLDAIGLPHQVVFQNDLNVEITELGRELDFDNLSRGERNRLILGLSFAFRDVWENLYKPINTLFIDELIDSGLDTMGVENAIAILKEMSRRRHKSIWLVSHREELAGRVPSVLKVIKENGFTSYHTDVTME
jgi:DNA repair exonuclease SbcCD ATPase subunit